MEEDNGLLITAIIKEDLNSTSQWGKFLAILGFILIGIIMLFSGVLMVSGEAGGALGGFSTATFILTYVIVAAIYFFPTLYLFNYSVRVGKAIRGDDQEQLASAFQNLRRLFVYFGIVTIVTLVFYGLAIIAVATGGLIGSAMQS